MPPIRKVNRNYKKNVPFRDARKFIIICEGERESEYFSFFDKKSQKLIIETIAPIDENQGESAPNHLKERASEYIDKNGWDKNYEDELWFVLDVDRWSRNSIDDLFQLSEQTSNWYIAISNQCFEVWLYYHKTDVKITPNNSSDAKRLLSTQVNGGYKLEEYAPNIGVATVNAKSIDENENGYFPDIGVTKVYKLGEKITRLLKVENGVIKLV